VSWSCWDRVKTLRNPGLRCSVQVWKPTGFHQRLLLQSSIFPDTQQLAEFEASSLFLEMAFRDMDAYNAQVGGVAAVFGHLHETLKMHPSRLIHTHTTAHSTHTHTTARAD
jgi:hypothetical protein